MPAPAAEPAAPLTSPIHIVVMASGYSWVRAVVDGTTVFEGFLNAGDRQGWEAAHDLTVKVGNAGVIEVSVNGRSLGRFGGSGQVIERSFSVGSALP